MRREVEMKYKMMILLAFVLFLGTAGAVETEIISLGTAAVQISLALGLGILGGYGLRVEERRRK